MSILSLAFRRGSSGGGVTTESLQSGSYNYAVASGTNTYTAEITPAITSLVEGMRFYIKFINGNTGTATLNLNGLGDIEMHYFDASGNYLFYGGEIRSGSVLEFIYNGTAFIHMSGAQKTVTRSISGQGIFPTYSIVAGAMVTTLSGEANVLSGYVTFTGSAFPSSGTLLTFTSSTPLYAPFGTPKIIISPTTTQTTLLRYYAVGLSDTQWAIYTANTTTVGHQYGFSYMVTI